MNRALLISIMLLAACGCEDPQADMGEQPKYKPMRPSEAFVDGASARPLVNGVIARDPDTVPGGPYISRGPTSMPSISIPMPITREVLERGQAQFEMFCSPCHGRLGNGQGMIVQRGLTPPPSYFVDRLRNAPDSHFYEVISNGYGAMFAYNDRVPVQQRWEIVAYIRALQSAPNVAATVTDATRAALIAAGDRTPFTAGGRQ